MPGIYAVTSIPFVKRTRATFLKAELGFFGVTVQTLVQTPLFWGLACSAGAFVFFLTFFRAWRTNWFIVGTRNLLRHFGANKDCIKINPLCQLISGLLDIFSTKPAMVA